MDEQEYYIVTRFNDYSVHFRNNHGLPIDKIKDIFSEFGEISSCKQTGDNYGLCFINYKTENAAKKCVNGLNNPKIKLRLAKSYRGSKNNTNNAAGESRKCHNFSSSLSKQSNLSEDKNINSQLQRLRVNQSNKTLEQCNSNNSSIDDSGPEKMFQDQSHTVIDENIYENDNKSMSDTSDNGNNIILTTADIKCEITPNYSHNEHDNSPIADMPALIEAPKKLVSMCDNIDDMTKSMINIPMKPVSIIEAQEIIVANIEDNYGAPAILHLLEKYQPICISSIKTNKRHSLRYCHVYFNSISQAEAAERDFDEYEWSERKKLIVLRVNNLAALSLAAQ